jgi:hypothetical protein
MYSHFPYFLYIVAMLYCSEDEEFFDEDLFYACETLSHLHVARWCPFRCLVLSGLVIRFCNKIQYNKDIGFLYLHSGRMYDNLILGIHTMSIWFGLKTRCDRSGTRAVLTVGGKTRVDWTPLRTYSLQNYFSKL